jgi:hypothetical protein
MEIAANNENAHLLVTIILVTLKMFPHSNIIVIIIPCPDIKVNINKLNGYDGRIGGAKPQTFFHRCVPS